MNSQLKRYEIDKVYIFHELIIFVIAGTLIFLNCINYPKNPHEGAWNIVSMQKISSDTLEWKYPGELSGSGMKIWAQKHFSFVGRYERDTTIVNSYGGGAYTLNGNQYTEKILYYGNQSRIGVEIKMLLEIKGDSLIQIWPVDDNWQIDKANYRIEKYIRLE